MSKVLKEKSVATAFVLYCGAKYSNILRGPVLFGATSSLSISRAHPFSTYAKFSEKLTFLTPRYAHVRLRSRG